MKEKLTIKSFGPLKSVELELGRFNVFIGEQGTGKSTVAKLLVAIQSTFFRDLLDLPADVSTNRESQLFFEYLKIVGLQNYYSDVSEIFYYTSMYSFELKGKKANITKITEPTFEESISYDINYIIAERPLISIISNSLYAFIEIGTALPKLFLRFGNKFQRATKDEDIYDYTDAIRVKYINKNNKESLILSSGKEVPFADASSGIQASITMLMVFDYINKQQKIKPFTADVGEGILNYLIVEEPELDCFPETQYKLIKHFIEKNTVKNDIGETYYKNRLLLTTHSPYILTSLNNFMEAYKSGQVDSDETEKILERKYWVNPDDISAYLMLPNGHCEDIMDREEGMIKAEKIDSLSQILNEQFDAMLNLEFANEQNP